MGQKNESKVIRLSGVYCNNNQTLKKDYNGIKSPRSKISLIAIGLNSISNVIVINQIKIIQKKNIELNSLIQ